MTKLNPNYKYFICASSHQKILSPLTYECPLDFAIKNSMAGRTDLTTRISNALKIRHVIFTALFYNLSYLHQFRKLQFLCTSIFTSQNSPSKPSHLINTTSAHMKILVQALYYCAMNPGAASTSLTWEGGSGSPFSLVPPMGFSGIGPVGTGCSRLTRSAANSISSHLLQCLSKCLIYGHLAHP